MARIQTSRLTVGGIETTRLTVGRIKHLSADAGRWPQCRARQRRSAAVGHYISAAAAAAAGLVRSGPTAAVHTKCGAGADAAG